MDKLSKDELLALINNKPEKKPRKKPDLSEDKKIAMLERLADMRETVKKNREAKKATDPIVKEKEIDAIFEKKYGTKFDKMTELLTDLNENTKETLKIKKEKLAKKAEEKKIEEKKPEPVALEIKPKPENILFDQTPGKPATVINAVVRPAFPTMPTPMNPNLHRKGNTRW
tara:strand:+ start:1543 stop:2055 length:513 start_codon:yes stop_codon:yes gene_type:complete